MNLNTKTNQQNIIGIGTDIIENDRFQKSCDTHGQRFLDRIFTKSEQAHCNKFSNPTPHFAARFAAKEAIANASGEGFGEKISFHDIEIINEPSGRPIVHLSSACAATFNNPTIHLSISHCHSHSTASAVAVTN